MPTSRISQVDLAAVRSGETDTIFRVLGGVQAVSELTECTAKAVRMWKPNGIPYKVFGRLLDAADKRGIPMTYADLEATRPPKECDAA